MAPIIKEYKLTVKPQITILKNYIKSKKNIITKFEEYKDTVKKNSSFSRLYNKIVTKYNVSRYEFRSYIRKHKHTTIHFRCTLSSIINRSFRIRI